MDSIRLALGLLLKLQKLGSAGQSKGSVGTLVSLLDNVKSGMAKDTKMKVCRLENKFKIIQQKLCLCWHTHLCCPCSRCVGDGTS